jgi:hypothetical protein
MPKPMLVASQSLGLLDAGLVGAPLHPSLALGRVATRRGFMSCGRDVKANPPDMARVVVQRVGAKKVGLH